MTSEMKSGAQLLGSFVEQTLARLKIAVLLGHGGEIGRAREQALRDLLGSFLPPSLGVSTGFVIDAHGGRSKQQDIIIHFADYHAVFNVGGIPLVPVEAVIAVLEVKSNAKSSKVIRACYDNLASVKKLDRSNDGQNVYLVDRQPFPGQADWEHFQFQVFAGVLALEGPSRSLWIETTAEWCMEHEVSEWPNFFCSTEDLVGAYEVSYPDQEPTLRPDPTYATSLAAWTPADDSPLAWAVQEVLNFVRVAKRIDYLPTSYFSDGETPASDIEIRPLP